MDDRSKELPPVESLQDQARRGTVEKWTFGEKLLVSVVLIVLFSSLRVSFGSTESNFYATASLCFPCGSQGEKRFPTSYRSEFSGGTGLGFRIDVSDNPGSGKHLRGSNDRIPAETTLTAAQRTEDYAKSWENYAQHFHDDDDEDDNDDHFA